MCDQRSVSVLVATPTKYPNVNFRSTTRSGQLLGFEALPQVRFKNCNKHKEAPTSPNPVGKQLAERGVTAGHKRVRNPLAIDQATHPRVEKRLAWSRALKGAEPGANPGLERSREEPNSRPPGNGEARCNTFKRSHEQSTSQSHGSPPCHRIARARAVARQRRGTDLHLAVALLEPERLLGELQPHELGEVNLHGLGELPRGCLLSNLISRRSCNCRDVSRVAVKRLKPLHQKAV